MSKNVLNAKTRVVCAGLAVLAAVGWSCSRKDEPAMNPHQTEGAIAQARSFYENTATSLTKTVADQTVAIKPLPGEMIPLWDRATAAALSDGTTAWVDVPITAGVTYTAVRGGTHAHEAGEECGHDHEAVQAVQKLTVYTAADGTKQSLIATIVPEPECTANLNDFSSADGLAGFSGFVSWHDLTGKLIRVAEYENGTKNRSAEPDGNNEAEILEIVDNAILYPFDAPTNNYTMTKVDDDYSLSCKICGEIMCKSKNNWSVHCRICKKYDNPGWAADSKCVCPRCPTCGKNIKPNSKHDLDVCKCKKPLPTPEACPICKKLVCSHKQNPSGVGGTPVIPYVAVHYNFLNTVLGYLFTDNGTGFKELDRGCDGLDRNFQLAGDEYLHGIYGYRDNSSQSTAKAQMRSHFISRMGQFIRSDSWMSFGEGLHSVLDTYISLQDRIDMLGYYSYETMRNIVDGQNIAPYTINSAPCWQAVLLILSELNTLEPTATDAQIGAIFDKWVGTTGGGDLLL